MEKENKVQQPDAAQGAEAQKEEGAVGSFGKFKSADALLNAYNSLEAEFTRRSQRLRELEGRLQDGNRMSVSYTHLDVYKRQALSSVPISKYVIF